MFVSCLKHLQHMYDVYELYSTDPTADIRLSKLGEWSLT